MHIRSRRILTAWFAISAWVVVSANCSEGCPKGSDAVQGQCVPQQQMAGNGAATDEAVQPTTRDPSEDAAGTTGDGGRAATPKPTPDAGMREAETARCAASEELCDEAMLDEDCDGMANEGCECISGDSEPCSAGKGVCTMGERQCEAGTWSACAALEEPSRERCDKLDNDCDGTIDGPNASCDNPDEKCVEPGRCAQCMTDRDCAKLTTGCEVGKCESGACSAKALEEYTACTGGYCIDKVCTAPREYRIENGDTGTGKNQVEYLGGSWEVAGSVHYSTTANAYFLAHFVGTKVEIYGGRNADRGITEYAICDAEGANCGAPVERDHYAATLQIEQLLWTSPTVPFGEHTVRGRATGRMASASTGIIVDLDFIDVN